MFVKTIKFIDFNGNEQEREYYFHLSKTEILKMEASKSGGIDKVLERFVKDKNYKEIVEFIEDIIMKSYGVKSVDGLTFDKTDDTRQAFKDSPAYDELFMELATDSNKLIDFINSIIPEDMKEEVEQVENSSAVVSFSTATKTE